MSHKKNLNANRNELFGGDGGGGSGRKPKKDIHSNRDALFGGSSSASTSKGGPSAASSSTGYSYGQGNKKSGANGKKKKVPTLSAVAKDAKKKEAEEFRKKAKKCMESGFFKRAEPVMGSNFYKRAADAYELCGEDRLARLHRASSADTHMAIAAYSTAAAEYTSVAESILEVDELSIEQKRQDSSTFHKKAAGAWKNMNENGKAAASIISSATVLMYEDDSRMLSKRVIMTLEESVEAHVPDVLNSYAKYRQTGISAFIDPENEEETVSNPSQQSIEMAKNHLITRAYAHEPLLDVANIFVDYGQYDSALYTFGAISAMLLHENMSTLTLSRTFCAETILTLALGDPIAAEQNFLSKHCQQSFYLTSRECKLSEDLFRAIKMRDIDDLEEARSPAGNNRSALSNLSESIRNLVQDLRLSGVARKGPTEKSSAKSKNNSAQQIRTLATMATESPTLDELSAQKIGLEKDTEGGADMDPEVLQAELDDLDFGSDEDLSDDDIDLR